MKRKHCFVLVIAIALIAALVLITIPNLSASHPVKDITPNTHPVQPIRESSVIVQNDTPTVDSPVSHAIIDSPKSSGITISGMVVDQSGNPIGDAKIDAGSSKEGHIAEARSTNDGTFMISGLSTTDHLVIHAWHDSLRSKPLGPMNLPFEGISGLRIILAPTASISGKVVDQNGNPVEKAFVKIKSSGDEGYVKSDASGHFLLGNLTPGHYLYYATRNHTAYNQNQPVNEVDLKAGDQLTGLVLVLENQGPFSIKGHVFDASRNPVNQARISAGEQDTTTDEHGVYALTGLKAGNYDLIALHPTYGKAVLSAIPAGNDQVDFVLPGLATIEGQVRSAATGQPIQAFKLLLKSDRTYPQNIRYLQGFKDFSDPNGRFRLDDVEVTDTILVANALSFAPAEKNIGPISPGKTTSNIIITLQPGQAISGNVVDRAGSPLSGVAIYPGNLPPEFARANPELTKEDGSFTLSGLLPGETTITAHAPAYAPVTVPLPKNPGQPIRIVLGQGGTIAGTVFLGKDPATDAIFSIDYRHGTIASSTTRSRIDGSFQLAGLTPGEVQVRLTLPTPSTDGLTKGREKILSAVIEEGHTTTLHFRFSPTDAALEGIITDEGKPARGHVIAQVRAGDGAEESFTASTDDTAGYYQFKNLPPGVASVSVHLDSSQPSRPNVSQTRLYTTSLKSGSVTQLNANFTRGTTLSGRVLGLHPGDCGYVNVFQGNPSLPDRHIEAETNLADNGSFRVENLQGGVYTLIATVFQRPSPGESVDPATERSGSVLLQVEEGIEKNVEIPIP